VPERRLVRRAKHHQLGIGTPERGTREDVERPTEPQVDRDSDDCRAVLPHLHQITDGTAAPQVLVDAVRDLPDVAIAEGTRVVDPTRERMLHREQVVVAIRPRADRHLVAEPAR
jgi:hypothetical protein